MFTTLKIDGMMCSMCEAHINDVIRKAVPGAKKVSASHTRGEASFVSEEAPDVSGLSLRYLRESGQPAEITKYEPRPVNRGSLLYSRLL